MWNPFSWVSAADKATDAGKDIIKGTISGIDKLFYTEEEKADYSIKRLELAQKAGESFVKHQELVLNENTARSITRRYIAVMITVSSLFLTILTIGISIYNLELAKTVLSIVNAFGIGNGFLAVIIFYFGPYGVSGIVEKVKK